MNKLLNLFIKNADRICARTLCEQSDAAFLSKKLVLQYVARVGQVCGSSKQKRDNLSASPSVLVETTGLEPVTPCMSSKYSNQLSYASVTGYIIHAKCEFVNRLDEKIEKAAFL